jgi:hypothetical protein
MLPVSGLYVRHARGVQLRNIEFRNPQGEMRPTLMCDDVQDIVVDGLRTTPISGLQPVIAMQDTSDAWVRNCAAPAGAASFLRAGGGASKEILVTGCDLRRAAAPLDLSSSGAAVTLHDNI